jgi:uncharacterized protein YfiM (DUF2279 family)
MLLGATLSMAQATGSTPASTDKPATKASSTKTGKKASAHKGGKKSKKSSSTTTPAPK